MASPPRSPSSAAACAFSRATGLIAGVDGVARAQVDRPLEEPTVQVKVDLARAQAVGVKPGDVRRAAASLLGGITVGNLFEQSFEEVWDMLGGKIAKKFPDMWKNDEDEGGKNMSEEEFFRAQMKAAGQDDLRPEFWRNMIEASEKANADGAVDEDAYAKLVEWQIAEGIDFLVPCGSTGEAQTLDDAERERKRNKDVC